MTTAPGMHRILNPAPHTLLTAALLLAHPGAGAEASRRMEAVSRPEPGGPSAPGAPGVLWIGGVGGVYFLAEPGELVVEVEKRDRNRRRGHHELRAILAGPDRRVLQEATIPDDGLPTGSGWGPRQRCRLAARVDGRGVCVLNVTVSQDRYGEAVAWAFRSNCRKYLIETARGHKDEAHQEPIVLASPDRPASICFMPRQKAFGVEVTGLPRAAAALRMLDARGTVLATLEVPAGGQVSHRFPTQRPRAAVPWRLELPAAEATVHIDGLTRWESGDPQPHLTCWTPDPASWFAWLDHRWLLTPYSRRVHGLPGESRNLTFQVHNSSARERSVQLGLEFPEDPSPAAAEAPGDACARLAVSRVTVAPGQSASVTLNCLLPASGRTCRVRLRATPADEPGFSTYSTLILKAEEAAASRPLAMPIVLEPYRHENDQFGCLPDYPVENQVYFDARNRPFVRTPHGISTWRDGRWVASAFRAAVTSRTPPFEGDTFGMTSTKLAFDRDNDLYALSTVGRTAALLHSADGGRTFAACVIPGRENRSRSFDFEQFSGHNALDGPPPILRYTLTRRDEQLIWRRLNDLELFVPKKHHGRIALGEPIPVSTRCLGWSGHSGMPAGVVSRGSKVHVVWGEATDPKLKVAGVPTFVASYDRATGQLGKPALVAHGPPANDVHNCPSITLDRQARLHVLAGTHGAPFPYARSLQPNDAQPRWTEPALTGDGLRQTYIGLVCGPDDTLHTVFRWWRFGVAPFPASSHATLAYQRKRPGRPWEPPRVLVVAPFSEYSVFYHRLTIDRKGRLFLSYDCWSTYWFYRNDHPGSRRVLLLSPDGGDTWKLAETSDF
ncbi:MAG: BNR-4 repeat-containing protein [Verrucomicrobia bacterium]|nr:BNR-4 repeat-containing protein [Verrucomicrobiota bacterium]